MGCRVDVDTTSFTFWPALPTRLRSCHWSERIWTSAPGVVDDILTSVSGGRTVVRSRHSSTWGPSPTRIWETAIREPSGAPGAVVK
jgi:hypothetical protein